MQFFPHRPASSTIGQSVYSAVSASRAVSASFINNFATIPIATASITLNISGSVGATGSNYTATGERGPQGTQGPRGPRGDHVYLLSGSWDQNENPVTICYELAQVGTSTFGNPDYSCEYGTPATYYSTSSILTDGTVLYYDYGCATLAANVTGLAWNGYGAFSTNGSGAVVYVDTCVNI